MKILHTITGLSQKSGGTSSCTYHLVQALNENGCPTDILTSAGTPDNPLIGSGDFIKAIPAHFHTPYAYSKEIRQALDLAVEYDLIHTNGLWLDLNYYSGVVARRKKIPYIVSPHGMLYPQALAIKPWRKRLMRLLCFNHLLRNAACIHVTCEEELHHYRALGFNNPVAVIPNLLPEIPGIEEVPQDRCIKRIGFLGRFHPIKNLSALLNAWCILENETKNAELLLIGSGSKAYEEELYHIASNAPNGNIRFCGFVDGKEKYRLLGSLTALCIPSLQENFGMTVLEALAMETPVIASKTTPWKELESEHCGWWVDNDPKSLADIIRRVLHLSEEERKEMGKNGKNLLLRKYHANIVSQQMMNLYHWLITDTETSAPEFVEFKNKTQNF